MRLYGNTCITDSSHVPAKVEDKNGAALVRALRVGVYSRYAGGLLLNVFVAKLIGGVFWRVRAVGVGRLR